MTIKIEDSIMVDVRNFNIAGNLKNPYGKMWKSTLDSFIGVHDLRARLGTFTTPWNAPSNSFYSAPEFKFINDSLSDLLDRRALEIFSVAKKTNKKIFVLWSGGIDSTAVLASFIKNLSSTDLELLTVVMNTGSMVENFEFYMKFISNKIKCFHYSLLDLNDDFLDKNILVHGDPADCLYGPTTVAYRELIISGEHKESYKKHFKKLIDLCQPGKHLPYSVPNFGNWIVKKITDNIEEVNPDNVTTVSDWWWWTYYNYKWEFSCQRPFIFSQKDVKKGISIENQKTFAENTFYNTEYFQHWSYSNLKNLLKDGMKSHKIEAKRYIFELDKNEFYFENKPKLAGAPPDVITRTSSDNPICFDRNWKGYFRWEDYLNEQVCYRLETFKG
jgi:hypothetical protein